MMSWLWLVLNFMIREVRSRWFRDGWPCSNEPVNELVDRPKHYHDKGFAGNSSSYALLMPTDAAVGHSNMQVLTRVLRGFRDVQTRLQDIGN